MGFTGLARWVNAPPSGLDLVRENIIVNHNGVYRGPWRLSVKSYRSTLGQIPNFHIPSERTMCALTMNENVFVLLEDPLAPTRADVLAAAPPGQEKEYLQGPTHFRTTFLTLQPPGALEQLLAQLKARWVSVRQSSGVPQRGQTGGQQLTIEGHIFAIGNDWLVRVGNVQLAGGAIKGMLLEAEYLPLPVLHSPIADGTSELLSNLLTSILPNVRDAKTVAVTINDTQWEDVLWDREEEEKGAQEVKAGSQEDLEDIYAFGDEDIPEKKRGDWVGVDRDRRMFSINRAARRLILPLIRHSGIRSESTALHFYQNRQLELYASKEAKRLTLRQLVFFGRSMDEERLIKSANYVRTELPIRIAHRLRDLQALPYVVVTQEGVAKVYELYWSAFEQFRRYPPITNLAENDEFCRFLTGILAEHGTVIPSLSLGLSLSSRYLPPDQLDSFMRRMLVSRISRRVLAEHHIALSEIHAGTHKESSTEPHVGIIFTGLNVRRSIQRCIKLLRARPVEVEDDYGRAVRGTRWPEVVIDGHLDTTFPYIREHLEYIVFELLKNSLRATVVKHHGSDILPDIRATIAASENDVGIRISDEGCFNTFDLASVNLNNYAGGGLLTPQNQIKTPSDLLSFSHVRNATRLEDSRLGVLRSFSTSPQGLKATVGEQVGRWQNTLLTQVEHEVESSSDNPEKEAGVGPHPRIGIGLPMSNIFATYFGGSLELVSLDGWGTDVYLRLPKLGTNLEGIEV
ncbi:putative alpha-ketoacid dehydrogenase kinase [Lyophyllum shimeji]|uniref:Protein-serine/threonine kinase n=1 Tax=Lyophyllum shimeji TaxID=47721 RepID=A0A9P3PDH7_LYOSH|nr:putative alpha-ketoacid dehydrogenase kinase [Lyophyllum shimeji]